jgi:hypothetical protein
MVSKRLTMFRDQARLFATQGASQQIEEAGI